MKVISAYSYDVRAKRPDLFAKLIMWWCWRGTDTPKEERWHHCIDAFKIGYEDGSWTTWVFSANEKYIKTNIFMYLQDYIVVNECNTIKEFDLSQEEILEVYQTANSFVNTDYGRDTILGLIIHDITRLVIVGVNGVKRLICSESSIRLYIRWIKKRFNIVGPIDFYDPLERFKLFNMKKINRE